MDVTDILPQLDRLDGEIDDLEDVLKPLLGSLSDVSSKFPLLDKAKLYVLVTYAIESMLFCKPKPSSTQSTLHHRRSNSSQPPSDSMGSTQRNTPSSRS